MEKNIAYNYYKHWFSTLVELVAVEDIEVYDYILMPDGYFLCVDDIEKEFIDEDFDDDEISEEDSDDSDIDDEISEEDFVETDENTVYTIYNLNPLFQKRKRFRQKSKQFPFGLQKLSTAAMISNIPPKSKFLVMRNLTFD